MSLIRKHGYSVPAMMALCCLAITLALVWLLAAPQNTFAQGKSYHMDQYNSSITVNTDGSLNVDEELKYVYDVGSFHRGLREIPLSRVQSITDVLVTETVNGQETSYTESDFNEDSDTNSGVPGTFGTKIESGNLRIRWIYDPTSNDTRTFHVKYKANGAVQVFNDVDRLEWKAIPPDWAVPIDASHVSVTLPGGVDAGTLETAVSRSEAEKSIQGSTITWSQGYINSGGLEVGVKIPTTVMQASKPDWQHYRDDVKPLIDVGLLLLGVLIAVAGVLLAVLRWYKAGRDKPVKLLSDYITEPPSDLPPGLVGTLIDESADVRDVIATVVDLGRKGNLVIRETGASGLLSSKDFQYELTNSNVQHPFEGLVMNAFFKHGNPVHLSDLKNTFYKDLDPIYNEMYGSLVALKYFPESPASVRNRNRGLAFLFLIMGAGIVFATFFLNLASSFSAMLIAPGVGLGITGFVWMLVAGAMPRKTDFGSEEAEKWRAFSRYLAQMQRYTDVQAAAGKFQQYLPYAVALGIERQLTSQFNSVPAAMPPYYIPYGWPIGGYYPYPIGSSVGGGQSTGAPGGGTMPQFDPAGAMQGMSDSFASAMQGMSDSFTSMVNSASSALTSQPSSSGSSGGGWSGGGGSFGGGGGGGGGGGAD